MTEPADRIVIVGASSAGLNGALALRRAGFAGSLTIVGAEPHRPYDRTLLSKTVPTGETAPEATVLPQDGTLAATWRLGAAAVSLEREARLVHLGDHDAIPYDRLLIATGVRARPWPNPRERQLKGVLVLRDREDAIRLRAALAAKPQHVVVVGGGFIGCEIAQAVRGLGLPVSLVEAEQAPLSRLLGTLVGSIVGAWLDEADVDLRLGRRVTRLEDDGFGHVIRVLLDDGHAIDTPLVVVAIGTVPNTEWLEDAGLALHAKGVECDERTRVLDHGGRPDPALFVAGDIAHFPHPLFGGRRIVVEHWQYAADQGAYAGATMAGRAPQEPFAVLPSIATSLGGFTLTVVGLTEGADGLVFAEGDPKSGRFLVAYGRAGRCVAAVAFNGAPGLPSYAEMIARGDPFPPIGRDGLRGDLMVLPLDLT